MGKGSNGEGERGGESVLDRKSDQNPKEVRKRVGGKNPEVLEPSSALLSKGD